MLLIIITVVVVIVVVVVAVNCPVRRSPQRIEILDSPTSGRRRCFLKRAVCNGSRAVVDRAVEVMGEPVSEAK